jgi:glucan phosphorylase
MRENLTYEDGYAKQRTRKEKWQVEKKKPNKSP